MGLETRYKMTVYGINATQVNAICEKLELVPTNERTSGKGYALKLEPPNSGHRYARTSGSGRKLKACSYEAFRDFILSCFESGATRVKTAWGDWRDVETFRDGLDDMAAKNIGSIMYPAYMADQSNERVPETVVSA